MNSRFIAGLLLIVAGCWLPVAGSTLWAWQTQSDKGPLQTLPAPGEVIKRELAGGATHTFSIPLKANDYLNLVVDQKGIDVVLRLSGPNGKVLREIDHPNGIQGWEQLFFLASESGGYRLEVVSLEKTALAGAYELKVRVLHPATADDKTEMEIETWLDQGKTLEDAGKYSEAITLYAKALEKAEPVADRFPVLVANSLNNLAVVSEATGDFAKAEAYHVRALALREKTLGPDNEDVAQSLNNLAMILYEKKGEFDRAESMFLRALAIWEKKYGPEHLEVARCLNNLAQFYRYTGNHQKAEPLYLRSLAIYEKVLGPDHEEVGVAVNNLASFYSSRGDYAKAESYFLRTRGIFEKALGPEHPNVAAILNNLGLLYMNKGEYAKVEPLFLRARAIWEKTLGPDHANIATICRVLAGFYSSQSDFTRAEPLFQQALAIDEKALGPTHPRVAISVNNLANMYRQKSDYARAEPLYQRALAIREKAFGPEHPEVASSLNNLALNFSNQNNFAQAEPLFQRALAILEKKLGPDHLELATPLTNLADLYRDKRDFDRAEPLYLRSLAIREKTLGPNHPVLTNSLDNLARLYVQKGEQAKAEPLFRRALAIREKVLGADHPEFATNLYSLALVSWAKGEVTEAVRSLIQGQEIIERDLVRNLVSGSEQQKALYLNQTGRWLRAILSVQAQAAPHDPAALRAALTEVLRRKGRSLDAMTSAVATVRSQGNPENQKLLDEYSSLAGQISVLALRGPGKQKPEDHLAAIRDLEDRKEKLENEISRRSLEFKAQQTPITLAAVQNLIPVDAALVEYASYIPLDPQNNPTGKRRYVVFVVKPGTRTPELQWADLGEAEPIDKAVAAYRKVLGSKTTSIPKEVKTAAQALETLITKPVRRLVGPAKHLLLSPDGMLNLIPFSALMDEKGKYLVENYTLTYLTSGRDLLRLQVALPFQQPPLVIANPDYADGPGPKLAGRSYNPLKLLPETAAEGQEIRHLLPATRLLVRNEATEEAVKSVRRPEILHIATHGYFLTDTTPAEATGGQRLLEREMALGGNEMGLQVKNPLLRSWLFFAGANHGGTADDDGIMTALEVAQLDLWGTRLTVLSACETGVGLAQSGEGVYGLRRALVLAGSEAQFMSLWSVSDEGTRKLMVEYYTRLKAGEGRSAALRHTQLKLLQNPQYRHPFYWASFIQSGAWTNLQGK
ncbi:MAG: tetratricopeptide repeat protein [Blastocatellia bacterium]|nr:tetratricopeptide repeat protein [Blastocatellia bacterium]